MCGSEDGHEAAWAPGASRGSGLPSVNDCYSEGLRRGTLRLEDQLISTGAYW